MRRLLALGLVGLGVCGGRARATADEPKVAPLPPIPRNRMSHDSERPFVTFSPDGKYLALSGLGIGSNTMFKLWDVATGREMNTIKLPPTGRAESVAFSPDGKTIAVQIVGAARRRILLQDLTTGQEKLAIEASSVATPIGSIAFSPDGKTLAGALANGARLWDAEKGTEKPSLMGPAKPAGSGNSGIVVAFSRDGNTLAVGEADGTIRLWDPKSGNQERKSASSTGIVLPLSHSVRMGRPWRR